MICCTSAGIAGRTDEARGAASAVPAKSTTPMKMRLLRRKRFIDDLKGLSIGCLADSGGHPACRSIVDHGRFISMPAKVLGSFGENVVDDAVVNHYAI